MKIIITAKEAMNKGIWDEVCDIKGYNTWCVSEGRMGSEYEIHLSEKEALSLGVIKR